MEEQLKVVQNNIEYYQFHWGTKENPQKNNSWNWWAFFMSAFWFAYRKMYTFFFFILLIQLIWSSVEFFFDIPIWAHVIFIGGLSSIIGLNSNRWYYKHTLKVLEKSKSVPEPYQQAFMKIKGGTHIGTAIGLSILYLFVASAFYTCLLQLPTKENIIDVVRIDYEEDFEAATEHPKWTYIESKNGYHLVEFTGRDYTNEEDVRIVFKVYLDKYLYDWDEVYLDGKKLSDEEVDEYWIGDDFSID